MYRRVPAWSVPLALVGVLLVSVGLTLALARRSASPDTPPQPPAFVPPLPSIPVQAFDVQQAGASGVWLANDRAPLQLRTDARVEALVPATLMDVQPGQWLAVIGVPNEVRNFSIRSLLLLPPGQPDADGVLRSPGGFAGHEASRDPAERPLLGGIVDRADATTLTLRGPDGPVIIQFTPNAPLRRLSQTAVSAIAEGDRVAVLGDRAVSDASALLVLPGGAR